MSGIGEASLFGSVFTTLEDENEKERFLSTASAYVATTALAPVTDELPISEALFSFVPENRQNSAEAAAVFKHLLATKVNTKSCFQQ